MGKRAVAALCVICIAMGAGAAEAATQLRIFDLKRGDTASWADVNVGCSEIVQSPDEIMCGGRHVYRFVQFTYTSIRVLEPKGTGWKLVYSTRRCCG